MKVPENAIDPDLITGNALIDKQHEEIVGLIHAFRQHIIMGTLEARQLRTFLNDIHDYAVNHFSAEERYMRRLKYPAYEKHRDEHLIFWGRLLDMMERCEEGDFGPACGDMIYAEVAAWLKDHINGEDKAIAKWAQALRGPLGGA